MMISSGTPVVKHRTQLKLAFVKKGLHWLMLLRNLKVDPILSTIVFKNSNVTSAPDSYLSALLLLYCPHSQPLNDGPHQLRSFILSNSNPAFR